MAEQSTNQPKRGAAKKSGDEEPVPELEVDPKPGSGAALKQQMKKAKLKKRPRR